MKTKVLIVDDCRISNFIITNMTVKVGLSTNPLSFSNGKEALEYLQLNKANGSAYIILLDINMPEMSGWEFLSNLTRDMDISDIHVVMISSSTDKADHNMARNFSCVIDYIEKPVDFNAGMRIKNNKHCAKYFFANQPVNNKQG